MRGLKGIGNFLTYKLLEKHYQNERFMFGKAFQSLFFSFGTYEFFIIHGTFLTRR
jgi:hypothetical protein